MDKTLTIKGEMKKEEEAKEEDYYYSERSYGSFGRMLSLPAKVQADKIKASFKNGILEIHLPKAEESNCHLSSTHLMLPLKNVQAY